MPSGRKTVHNADLLGKNYNQTSHIMLLDLVKQKPPEQTKRYTSTPLFLCWCSSPFLFAPCSALVVLGFFSSLMWWVSAESLSGFQPASELIKAAFFEN